MRVIGVGELVAAPTAEVQEAGFEAVAAKLALVHRYQVNVLMLTFGVASQVPPTALIWLVPLANAVPEIVGGLALVGERVTDWVAIVFLRVAFTEFVEIAYNSM